MRKNKQTKKTFGLTVKVEDGKLDLALRLFKKKVEDSGLLQDLRDKEEYIKPSIQRKLKRNAAKKRLARRLKEESLPQRMY